MPAEAGTQDPNKQLADVAIIGGGASGSLLAGHLLRGEGQGPIVIVEKRGAFGPGLAYSTNEATHLLNVPAGGMSAIHDEPNHLVDWLEAAAMPATAESFVPRSTYGVYLRSVLDDAERASKRPLIRVQGTATAARITPEGAEVEVEGRPPVRARRVVLALGNSQPAALGFLKTVPDERYLADPWDTSRLNRIRTDEPVLLVGTGLTAVDVALSLASRGHRGPIRAASRHGLLPQVHRYPADRPASLRTLAALGSPMTAAGLLRWVRQEIEHAEREGGDWRDVMNALRPWWQKLWTSLPHGERRTFIRHLSRYWAVHRHRMAPEIGAEIERLMAERRLEVLAGRISVERRDHGVDVLVEALDGKAIRKVHAAWVINCTGPDLDPTRSEDPLSVSLLSQGAARRDPLGLGFECTTDGALIDESGNPRDVLWAIGPPRVGSLWESTALPEIREQAATLAVALDTDANAPAMRPLESV